MCASRSENEAVQSWSAATTLLPPGSRGADGENGVPAARAEACLAALHDAGIGAAAIGMVEAGAAAIRLERVGPAVEL